MPQQNMFSMVKLRPMQVRPQGVQAPSSEPAAFQQVKLRPLQGKAQVRRHSLTPADVPVQREVPSTALVVRRSILDEQDRKENDHDGSIPKSTPSKLSAVSPTVRLSDVELQHPEPVIPPNNHHQCSWKTSYMGLAAEMRQLKAELTCRHHPAAKSAGAASAKLSTSVAHVGVQAGLNGDENSGIQGLTVVLHLRGKEDLVIHTNLAQDPD